MQSGLQRHCPPDFADQVAEWIKAGSKFKRICRKESMFTSLIFLAMRDLDGNEVIIPPWTSTSEGAATVITAMIDPTIAGW